MTPVVVVGAGLAGLTCARTLKRNRIPFLLLDADDRPGGRLKTDMVGGYRLDRGHQAYLTAYPTAREQLDEDKLDLREYEPGAFIVWDGERHLVGHGGGLSLAMPGFLGSGDRFRLGKWTSDIQWLNQEDIAELPDGSIAQHLRSRGFSDAFIERFARPMLGALLMDRTLSTSCHQAVFLWKALTEGAMTAPALGIEAIPRQLAATFGPEVLRLGTRVSELIRADGRVAGVRLERGEEIAADTVVLACDAAQSARLSGIEIAPEMLHSVTLYFSAADAPIDGRRLVLNGNMRGITHLFAPISNVAAETRAGERSLFSATILGERPETDEQLAEIVRSELRLWFPEKSTEDWTFIRAYRGPAAMAQPSGYRDALPGIDSGIPGLYFAGEYTTNGSIDGAIRSGKECAELILDRLAVGVA